MFVYVCVSVCSVPIWFFFTLKLLIGIGKVYNCFSPWKKYSFPNFYFLKLNLKMGRGLGKRVDLGGEFF